MRVVKGDIMSYLFFFLVCVEYIPKISSGPNRLFKSKKQIQESPNTSFLSSVYLNFCVDYGGQR